MNLTSVVNLLVEALIILLQLHYAKLAKQWIHVAKL